MFILAERHVSSQVFTSIRTAAKLVIHTSFFSLQVFFVAAEGTQLHGIREIKRHIKNKNGKKINLQETIGF